MRVTFTDDDVMAVTDLLRRHGVLDEALARAREHVTAGLATVRAAAKAEAHGALEAVGDFVLSRTL